MYDKRKISVTVFAVLTLLSDQYQDYASKIFIIFLSNLTLNLIELGGVRFQAMPSALTCFQ